MIPVALSDVCAMLDGLGLPWANTKFADGQEPAPPFICLVGGYTDAAYADNAQWMRYMVYDVALYTSARDYETERMVEDALEARGISVEKSVTPIDGEHLVEAAYEIPVIED